MPSCGQVPIGERLAACRPRAARRRDDDRAAACSVVLPLQMPMAASVEGPATPSGASGGVASWKARTAVGCRLVERAAGLRGRGHVTVLDQLVLQALHRRALRPAAEPRVGEAQRRRFGVDARVDPHLGERQRCGHAVDAQRRVVGLEDGHRLRSGLVVLLRQRGVVQAERSESELQTGNAAHPSSRFPCRHRWCTTTTRARRRERPVTPASLPSSH